MSANSSRTTAALALIAEDMRAMDAVIAQRLDSDVPLVAHVSQYIIAAGGKRLRPALLLLMCGALVHRTLDAKGDLTVHQCIQSVVLADAVIVTRMELGATLAHDDAACVDHFAAKLLDAEHLGL